MRRGSTLLELVVAVVLLAIASAAALSAWGLSMSVPRSKRLTEMGLSLALGEIERLKAHRFLGLTVTPPGAPLASYRDPTGAPIGSPVPRGYTLKSSVVVVQDANGVRDTEDLLEVRVEVWFADSDQDRLCGQARTLLTFGGA